MSTDSGESSGVGSAMRQTRHPASRIRLLASASSMRSRPSLSVFHRMRTAGLIVPTSESMSWYCGRSLVVPDMAASSYSLTMR